MNPDVSHLTSKPSSPCTQKFLSSCRVCVVWINYISPTERVGSSVFYLPSQILWCGCDRQSGLLGSESQMSLHAEPAMPGLKLAVQKVVHAANQGVTDIQVALMTPNNHIKYENNSLSTICCSCLSLSWVFFLIVGEVGCSQ